MKSPENAKPLDEGFVAYGSLWRQGRALVGNMKDSLCMQKDTEGFVVHRESGGWCYYRVVLW